MPDERDLVAIERARIDQTLAGVKEMASLLVLFRDELRAGNVPDSLSDVLTRDYFDAMLGNAYGSDDEEDE
jgi:hypothetical protein